MGNCLHRARPRAKTRRKGARGEVGDLTGTRKTEHRRARSDAAKVCAGGRQIVVVPGSRTFFNKGLDKLGGACYTISASVARNISFHLVLDRPRPPRMAL